MLFFRLDSIRWIFVILLTACAIAIFISVFSIDDISIFSPISFAKLDQSAYCNNSHVTHYHELRVIDPNDNLTPCQSQNNSQRLIVPIESLSNNSSHCLSSNTCIMYGKNEFRCFPLFSIIGSMKSGTGELMKLLAQHPNLLVGNGPTGTREVHYFSRYYQKEKSIIWNAVEYSKRFPIVSKSEIRTTFTYDKSPDYIDSPAGLKLMYNMIHGLKTIWLMRNPISRLYSEFEHHCRHGRYVRLLAPLTVTARLTLKSVYNDSFPFHEINPDSELFSDSRTFNLSRNSIQKCMPITGSKSVRIFLALNSGELWSAILKPQYFSILTYPCSPQQLHDYLFPSSNLFELNDDYYFAYEMSRGFYDFKLKQWLASNNHNHLLVLFQEDFWSGVSDTIQKVLNFLQLPCTFKSTDTSTQPLMDWLFPKKSRYGGKMLNETREKLKLIYDGHNYDLALILQKLLEDRSNVVVGGASRKGILPAEWN